MEHQRRLHQVWNWLPAFRAVAETEHLPTASEALHISPSALSRAIKQLEEELGQKLFRRVGRRLELSHAGEELLRALKESMARLDRGLSAASTTQYVGPIRVSAMEPFGSAFVADALDALVQGHPLMVPHLLSLATATACHWVADRRLDVAIVDDPVQADDLTIARLGRLRYGVYCGESHPLLREPSLSIEQVLAHPFVAPPPTVVHPWPRELKREVGMVVAESHLAIRACANSRMLAFLPDVIAQAYRGPGSLRRLALGLRCGRDVFVVHRNTTADGPVLTLLSELKHALAKVAGAIE